MTDYDIRVQFDRSDVLEQFGDGDRLLNRIAVAIDENEEYYPDFDAWRGEITDDESGDRGTVSIRWDPDKSPSEVPDYERISALVNDLSRLPGIDRAEIGPEAPAYRDGLGGDPIRDELSEVFGSERILRDNEVIGFLALDDVRYIDRLEYVNEMNLNAEAIDEYLRDEGWITEADIDLDLEGVRTSRFAAAPPDEGRHIVWHVPDGHTARITQIRYLGDEISFLPASVEIMEIPRIEG